MSWTAYNQKIHVLVSVHDEAPPSLLAHIELQVEIAARRLDQAIRDLELPDDLITAEVQ